MFWLYAHNLDLELSHTIFIVLFRMILHASKHKIWLKVAESVWELIDLC